AIAEYNEAVDEWNALAEDYNRKVMEFFAVFEEFTAKLPAFEYNSSKITPDGKKVASTLTMLENPEDFWSAQLTFPARIDIATGEYEVIGNKNNLSVWSVLADGRITASTPVVDGNIMGYIETEDGELISIYDYINNLRPDYGAWMKENMTHTVEVDYDPETYAPIYDELLISGAALASRDAGKIVTWTTNTWDYDSPVLYYTYYFDMNATNSVGNTTADSLKAEIVGCEVYDLYGRRVLQTTEKNSVKNAALAKGVYLVKTILSNGESTTEKMSF
ncbi:MAG: T9SS type A sorting domain-containing protein, partial [Muribaculaceae bacterium]|nr:T9SS type A sorting domain-containing protein [Muribaculaceae bacterium]